MKLCVTAGILALLLLTPSFSLFPHIHRASAFLGMPNPSYTLHASILGWNSSQPSGTNPTIVSSFLFPGQVLTATGVGVDASFHNLAYYVPGTLPSQVSTVNHCGSPGDACLARSGTISSSSSQTLAFSFSSADTFEYYCEFHPSTMHGRVFVYRSPDINGDRVVNIIDLVAVALVFGMSGSGANMAVDLNRDGTVNILDVVAVALNFGRTV